MNNYAQYLTRMTESTEHTTKALIPVYASMCVANIEKPHILEVGIGSCVIGKLVREAIPNAYLVGLDINKDNIENARQLGYYDRLSTQSVMDFEGREQFDLVIFSSVLHEIGSYDVHFVLDLNEKYTVDMMLRQAQWLTKTNGHIIIRDGLTESEELRNTIDTYFTEKHETLTKLYRFVEQFKTYRQDDFKLDMFDVKTHVREKASVYYEINCPRWLMREFLCTATWGDESWEREIKERFCFTDDETMRNMLNRHSFKIKTALYSSEEYNTYFEKLISYPNIQNIIGFYVAEKEAW